MRKPDIYLKEYAKKLSDDALRFLAGSMHQKLSDDLCKVFNYFSTVKEIDRWFQSAQTSQDFHCMLDTIQDILVKEYEDRFKSSVSLAIV